MTTNIVIIVAMESERIHLDALMPGWVPLDDTVWPTLRNGDVICITCGIGMVLAAAATQHAISTYGPSLILNYGCAGAHHRELYPGDVVIGDRLIHQGRMRFAADGEIIARADGFDVPGAADHFTGLSTDPVLRKLAEEVSNATLFPRWPREIRLKNQPERDPVVRTGTVSSADIWLQSETMIDHRNQLTGSLCEDMEAASIAQICALYDLPFLTVKDISNSELHEKTVFDEQTWVEHAQDLGLRAAMVVVGVINQLRNVDSATYLRA